jgi:lysophospholipase L1-like esterase
MTFEPDRRVSVEEYRANLAVMKRKVDALGSCAMAVMTCPVVVDRRHVWYEAFKDIGGQDACLEKYRKATRQFAFEHGVPVFELDRVIRENVDEYILPDGVHLTAAGNRAAAAALLPFVLALTTAETNRYSR